MSLIQSLKPHMSYICYITSNNMSIYKTDSFLFSFDIINTRGDTVNHRLGEVIEHYLRTNPHISLRQLAEKSGISRGYLSALKQNRNPSTNKPLDPSIGTLQKLADGMDMPLERLLFLAGFTKEEGVGMDLKEVPKEVRTLLAEQGYDYLVVTKEAHEKGITPEMLEILVESASRLRKI